MAGFGKDLGGVLRAGLGSTGGQRGGGNVKGRLGGTTTCQMKHNGRRHGKGFVHCAVGVVDAGLCSRLGGASSLHLWFGLWSCLLWVNKGDCPGWRGKECPGTGAMQCLGDVPDRSVLSKWAPAGDVRVQRTRLRGTGHAVHATGGDV